MSNDLNKVLLIGRLSKITPATAKRPLRLVVNTSTPQPESPGVIHVVTTEHRVDVHPSPMADGCACHLQAGRLVYVEGVLGAKGVIRARYVHYLGSGSSKGA